MITIKKVKVRSYSRSTYGPEVWCSVYLQYKDRFFKVHQLIQTEQKLTDKEAMDIIKGRYDELTKYVLRLVFG